MRKTALLFLFAVVITMSLVSCDSTRTDGDCLGYQLQPFELSARITLDGNDFTCDVTSMPSEKISITVTDPGRLNGLCFEMADGSENEFTVTIGGTSFKCDGEYARKNGVIAAAVLFRIAKESFVDAEVIEASGVRLNAADFLWDFGRARVFLDTDGIPHRIEGNVYGHEITVVVENFKIIREEQ